MKFVSPFAFAQLALAMFYAYGLFEEATFSPLCAHLKNIERTHQLYNSIGQIPHLGSCTAVERKTFTKHIQCNNKNFVLLSLNAGYMVCGHRAFHLKSLLNIVLPFDINFCGGKNC